MKTTTEGVTAEVRARLPKVLIDYLWALVRAEEVRAFRLIPCMLGTGQVQDIICEVPDGQAWHRVFGFEPVRASITVHRSENQVILEPEF